jgi:hypothetical protein
MYETSFLDDEEREEHQAPRGGALYFKTDGKR